MATSYSNRWFISDDKLLVQIKSLSEHVLFIIQIYEEQE